MKKAILLFLSAALLTASLSSTAQAADTSALPALELDAPLSFTFAPTAEKDHDKGAAEATFTPEQDGWYEFICDTPYTGMEPVEGDNSIATCTATICEETDESFGVVGMAWCYDLSPLDSSSLSEEEREALEQLKELNPHSTEIAFTANLEGGKTYVFRFSNESASSFTTNLTISTHTHEYTEEKTEKAKVSASETGFGGVYRECTTWYCSLIDYTETFSAVSDCSLNKDKYVYDGKAKQPSVTVTNMDGENLNKKFYTVSYKDNKKVGKATVTIKFKGNYEGTLKRTFKIVPAGTKLKKASGKKKSVALKWAKQSAETSGYQIQYATNKSFKSAKSVTVKGSKTTSKTIEKLKSKKKYYFRIRTYKDVNGKKYYSGWSAAKAAKTLKKASGKKKSVALKWAKQSAETSGYQIQYATNKSFKSAKSVTVKGSKTTSKTIKKPKSKKKYYFRIRTCKDVNGKKYYSGWSAAKAAKTK